MNDTNAFERQLSAEVAALMGPVRPVDDAAIFAATSTATQSPKWRFQSMFSATKFVVAGAIVALFGGFLLAGLLTQPSDEPVPAVGASSDASLSPEPARDVRELEWRPLDLDEATFGPGARLVDIAASDSMLIIGGSVDGSAAIWTSTDGVTWERVPHDEAVFGGPADQEIKAITPWRNGFVAAGEVDPGSDGGLQRVAAVWVSEDGVTWTRVPHDDEIFGGWGRQEMFDIAAIEDRLVIVGFDEEVAGRNEDIAVWTSADGSAWTQQTFGGGQMRAVEATPEGFVAVGHGGMWTSSDGRRWERTDPGGLRLAGISGLTQTSDGLVAVGGSSGDRPAAWTSTDGATWASATIDAPSGDGEWWGPNDVAFADSGLAATAGPGDTGGESRILVSADGGTWTPGNTSVDVADACLGGIASFGPHFVAIGPGSTKCDRMPSSIWTTFEPRPSAPDVERAPDAATGGLGTFSPAGSLAEGRFGHTATRLPDGHVLVVGGIGHGSDEEMAGQLASAEVWDPARASFSPGGSLAVERIGHTATLLSDGRVLVVGGCCDDGAPGELASAEVWDPARASFSPAGSLVEGRFEHSATLLPDGRVLLVGGSGGDDPGNLASAEVWVPSASTSRPAGSLALARRGHTATLLPDGRVLIVGGRRGGDVEKFPTLAEVWDPATASFSPAGSLAGGRWFHTATLLPDGRVLILGGNDGDALDESPYASTEAWDPVTASFSSAASLAEDRAGHTATLLPDGRVLVVGGLVRRVFASTEVWDPVTASFGPAGSPDEDRAGHTATLLPEGRVLIVGDPGFDEYVASAEVWEPGTGQPPADDATDTTTPDLLPGVDLVTEEVEPGVYRVLSDGAGHDFGNAGMPTMDGDGSVWMASTLVSLSDHGSIFQVGQTGGHPGGSRLLAFATDGTVWASDRNQPQSVRSFDGETWTRRGGNPQPAGSEPDPLLLADYIVAFAVHPDGSVWQIGERNGDDGHPTLRHLGPDGWTTYAIGAGHAIGEGLSSLPCGEDLTGSNHLVITPDGTVWVSIDNSGLLGFEGDEWRVARPLGPDIDYCVTSVAANRDGVLWAEVQTVEGRPRLGDGRHLARFDGREWEVFSTGPSTDGLGEPADDHAGPWGIEAVGPHGTVWLTDDSSEPGVPRRSFPVSFDGERWNRYPEVLEDWASNPLNESLRRPSVAQMAIGPDGAAWVAVSAGDERGHHNGLYVITREAVAAAE